MRGIIHAACPPQQLEVGGGRRGRDEAELESNANGTAIITASKPAGRMGIGLGMDTSFLDAKVTGALHLSDGAARLSMQLEFLVVFSSASALLGLSGEAGYAAANSCLDGLAW